MKSLQDKSTAGLLCLILAAAVSGSAVGSEQSWAVSTVFIAQEVIPAGGVALDAAEYAVVYASDKTNAAIWQLNMTASTVQLLTGQPSGAKGVKDGPRDTASFNQPRGICKEETSGQLIVVDGVGSTAVLRSVVTSGQNAASGTSAHLDGRGSVAC
ncbi:hypothetical protein OEZ85_006295 [Tetradesmus obliquus]|uniref:Uncharacterized protein n=1 Tax=Tetradesmus obliquus TaxID=3088 RepID=A0ABY8TU22_TETOB|nr:hypothetical protein OEZ85_006295 [Tetradesmus obliquus]